MLFSKLKNYYHLEHHPQGPAFFQKLRLLRKLPDVANDSAIQILWPDNVTKLLLQPNSWSNIEPLHGNRYLLHSKTDLPNQLITFNSLYEENLLKNSRPSHFPREVAQFKVRFAGNVEKFSSIYYGNSDSVGQQDDMFKSLLNIVHDAKKTGLPVISFELLHTHPSLDFIIKSSKSSKLYLHSLGNGDIRTGKFFSLHCPWPLQIKAVSPSGISYSIICFQGKIKHF